ncbi:protein FAM204A isoform X1 [Paramormyrops kingsleyae]|uniref:protein FAM204A isoform X1 n=1 Tax=Paramormyrops kingsleyae TaxID=1676925 RepID=UPI000CD66F2D|nr:protein FAM204A isoform X1 [Paramormyrops kingsleyae]XP_023698120.1 protein FAM204A isoform X1 [Paramormyrops kingsleyae]
MYSGLPSGLSYSDSESDSEDCKTLSQNQTEQQHETEKNDYQRDHSVITDPTEKLASIDTEDCLPGVSPQLWQKFRELKKKNQEQKLLEVKCKRRKRNKKGDTAACELEKKRKLQAEHEEQWNNLKQYFSINDRFQPPPCNRSSVKTGLENSIDLAITEGDYGKAEELSDRLATRELAVKIAKATDCRDFVKTKQEAAASGEAQKKKKQVAWGFEAKKRWETKSNMGYM